MVKRIEDTKPKQHSPIERRISNQQKTTIPLL